MYRSNPQFVPVQRVSDRVNNANLDDQRILYRYEAPNRRQFAVAQDRRERFFSDIDARYASQLSPYRDVDDTRCSTADCDSCTCGNYNRYQANNCQSGVCYGDRCWASDCQSGCCGDNCSLNDCQSGCCGDSCQRPYEQQARPRMFYRFS